MVPRLAAAAGACVLTLGVLAGCGGDASSSVADAGAVAASSAAPKVSQPTAPGQEVRPGVGTPAAFTAALRRNRVVAVAFLMPGAADDEAVRQGVRQARASAAGRNVTFLTYSLRDTKRFGDLPELLDVSGTPTVVVIGRDHRITNVLRGLTDAQIIRQALNDAKDTVPATAAAADADEPGSTGAKTVKTGATASAKPTGDPQAIALVKRINAHVKSSKGFAGKTVMRSDRLGGFEMTGDFTIAVAGKGRPEFFMRLTAPRLEGEYFEMLGAAGVMYVRAPGAPCWTANDMGPDEGFAVGMESDGERFLPLVRKGGLVTVTAVKGAERRTMTVVEKTLEVKSLTMGFADGSATLRGKLADTAPELPEPDPVCPTP